MLGIGINLWQRNNGVKTPAPLAPLLSPSSGLSDSHTITRATTATLVDWEGVIRTAKAGELRVEKARRVENLTKDSENLTTANWLKKTNISVALQEDGWTKVIFDGTNDPHIYQFFTDGKPLAGRTFRLSVDLYTDAGQKTNPQLFIYNSSVTEVASLTLNITTSPSRYSISKTFTSTPNTSLTFRIDGPDIPDAGGYIYAKNIQLEDVTGQADTTASEYVSNGVLRKNLFQYTDSFDNTIWTKSNCTAVNNTFTGITGTSSKYIRQNVTVVIGSQYTLSIKLRKGTGIMQVATNTIWAGGSYLNIDSSNGDVGGLWADYVITQDENHIYLELSGSATNTAAGILLSIVSSLSSERLTTTSAVDTFTIDEIQFENGTVPTEYQKVLSDINYHGAGVDGVKYFTTKKDGSPLDVEPYVLVEKQGTNIWTNPEGGYASYNTKSGGVDSISSNGLNGFVEFDNTVNPAVRYAYKTVSTTTGQPYVISVFIRSQTKPNISTSSGSGTCCIVMGAVLLTYTKIIYEQISLNLWKCKVFFFAPNTGGSVGIVQYTPQLSKFSFTGIQLEQSTYPSSYIPTAGTAVTRSADVLKYEFGAGNFPQEFCYYADFEPLIDESVSTNLGDYRLFGTDDTNGQGAEMRGLGDSSVWLIAKTSTGLAAYYTLPYSGISIHTRTKIANSFQQSDQSTFKDGTQKFENTLTLTGTHSDTGILEIANWAGTVMPMKIYSAGLYPAMKENQLKKLTKL